jgi:hypothetical protein
LSNKLVQRIATLAWLKRMGGEKTELSVEDVAKMAVRLATLPEDGPTGGFNYMDDQLPG